MAILDRELGRVEDVPKRSLSARQLFQTGSRLLPAIIIPAISKLRY
jgi:hypothetical protein